MKFQPEHSDAQSITGYGPGWISVDSEKISDSIMLGARGLRMAWPCARFEDLTPAHFAQLAQLDAELILFGSGTAKPLCAACVAAAPDGAAHRRGDHGHPRGLPHLQHFGGRRTQCDCRPDSRTAGILTGKTGVSG